MQSVSLTRSSKASRRFLLFVIVIVIVQSFLMATVKSFESRHLVPNPNRNSRDEHTMTSSLHAIQQQQQQQQQLQQLPDEIPTVFGEIIRGEVSAPILTESSTLLAFRDRTPRAPLHALIVPKQKWIPSVFELDGDDDDVELLLEEMREMARSLIEEYHPEALQAEDYVLCFHVPPFNSVDHLHLHVLAPASDMLAWPRIKYKVGSRWCISYQTVYERLKLGQGPVPFGKWDFLPPVIGTCVVLVAVPTFLISVL
jgi:diadenosine tetraphosphate (Ap4A) HIT family hydrolase